MTPDMAPDWHDVDDCERMTEGWQPIETAPTDGTPVDLWAAERERYVNSRITDCVFVKGRWMHYRTVFDDDEMCDASDMAPLFNATHWMPIPASPEVA